MFQPALEQLVWLFFTMFFVFLLPVRNGFAATMCILSLCFTALSLGALLFYIQH